MQPRINSLDSFKFIAAIGVICLHSGAFRNSSFYAHVLLVQISSVAVPFFFLVSGYLFRKRIMDDGIINSRYSRNMKRLGLIFGVWTIIYLFIPKNYTMLDNATQLGIWPGFRMVLDSSVSEIVKSPINFMLYGTSPHLWFLVALAIAISMLYFFIKIRHENLFLYLAVPLYIFQLMYGTYSNTPFGLHFDFGYNGAFIACLFVGIGALIARKEYCSSFLLAGFLLLAGLVMQLGEGLILFKFYNVSNISFTGNYFFTAVYGTGLLLLALALPDFGYNIKLSTLGKFALGIYATHMLFSPVVQSITQNLRLTDYELLGDVLSPILILIPSLLLTIGIMQLPYVKKIVT